MKSKLTRRSFVGLLGVIGIGVGCKTINSSTITTTKNSNNTEYLNNILKDCENNITKANIEYLFTVLIADDVTPEQVKAFCRVAYCYSDLFMKTINRQDEYIVKSHLITKVLNKNIIANNRSY